MTTGIWERNKSQLNKQTFIRLWQPLTKAGLHRHTK